MIIYVAYKLWSFR